MLTIREALELPVMTGARVVAGHDGLDNRIRWVHIIDIADANYELGRSSILLLTTGFGLHRSPRRQAALIPKLVEQGFAGMVLSTGYYFEQTPPAIRAAADERDFPIIEIPSEMLFIDITEKLSEQIINRQYTLLQRSNQIHKQLIDLVLQGGNLHDLAATLADQLSRTIIIEDKALRTLAEASHGPSDEARRRGATYGQTTPEVAQYLEEAGLYRAMHTEMKPIYVEPKPELGLTLKRMMAPIIVDREPHGYIWLVGDPHPWTELDEAALGHGATVAALMILKQQAVQEAQAELRGDFFEQLIQRDPENNALLAEQAQRLNYHLEETHQVLIIRDTTDPPDYMLLETIEEWFRQRGRRPLLVSREEGVVVVIESRTLAAGKQVAEALLRDLSRPYNHLLIGVGGVFEAGNGELSVLHRSYEEARESIRVGLSLEQAEGIIVFAELGLLHWLYQLSPERRSDNAYLRQVQALVQYDERNNTELVKTVRVYVEHSGSLVETAEALHIHRNTLIHRLGRIEDVCQIDLGDSLLRLNLYAALQSYRLHGG